MSELLSDKLNRDIGNFHKSFREHRYVNNDYNLARANELEKILPDIIKLEQDIEKAFDVLKFYGVPKERAKTLSNGIQVLMSRIQKEIRYLECEKKGLEQTIDVLQADKKKLLEMIIMKICGECMICPKIVITERCEHNCLNMDLIKQIEKITNKTWEEINKEI